LKELGGSRFQISLSSTLAWGAIMLFSRFWGALSDAWSVRRATILLAAIGATATTLILVGSRSVTDVLVGRFLVEVFGAGLAPAALALLSGRGSGAGRGKRISIFTTSQSIGLLSGSFLGGFLSSNVAFNGAFGVVAAFSGVTVIAAILIPPRDGEMGGRDRSLRNVVRKIPPSFDAVTENRSLVERGLLHVYGGVVLRKAGVVGMYGLIIIYLQERLGLTAFTSGALSGINPAAQAIFMPLWGRGADMLGRRPVFLAGYALTLLVPALILFSDSIWLLIGSFLVLGVGFAGFITGITAYVGDVAPEDKQGELMGLVKVSQGFGGILGPLVAGVVSSPSVAGYDGMFVTMFGVILVGLTLIFVGTRGSRSGRDRSHSGGPRPVRCD
jgi:MFS family permease